MAEVVKLGPKAAETSEEIVNRIWAEVFKGRRFGDPKPKPTVAVTSEPLEGKVAEVARANPKGVEVRVTARDADGTTYVQPPRRPREIVHVLDVEPGTCRPARARHIDCATGDVSIRDYNNGYSQGGGVVHEYDPLAALKRD